MAARFPRIAVSKPALLMVCLWLGTVFSSVAAQQEDTASGRIGIRDYFLTGVYDNMTNPWVPAHGMRSPAPLRIRGLFLQGEIPGFRQEVAVQRNQPAIFFQTLYGVRTVQRPSVVGFEDYLRRVREDQNRRMMLAGFFR